MKCISHPMDGLPLLSQNEQKSKCDRYVPVHVRSCSYLCLCFQACEKLSYLLMWLIQRYVKNLVHVCEKFVYTYEK